MKRFLFLLGFLSLGGILYGQQKEVEVYTYRSFVEVTGGANIWLEGSKSMSIQATVGTIISEKYLFAIGAGIGARNYEYVMIPFEFGIMLWESNGAIRAYVGPSYEITGEAKGFIAGTELAFTPRFENRNLKLMLAIGVAFDRSANFGSFGGIPVDSIGKDVVAGPRIRIGVAL